MKNVLSFFCLISALIPFNVAISFFRPDSNTRNDIFNIRSAELQFQSPQGRELRTEFDAFNDPILRLLRSQIFTQYNRKRSLQLNRSLGKLQRIVSAKTPFPCDLKYSRSSARPRTVHELRPGDIDVIACIGDSMTAGTCLLTESFTQVGYESRGIAFSCGGYGTWRQYLTLPNILKVFNPKLYGYSTADGFSYSNTTRFNVAEPTAMSRDLVHQARNLIKRLRQDPNVDFDNDWKLITIFMSNVDFCVDYCLHDDVTVSLRNHERDLRECLALLRDNVPHVFVNLLPAPNAIETFRKMTVSLPCYVIHRVFCFCVINSNSTDADRRAYGERIRLWQELDEHIANLDEFNTDDFTVVYHPFLINPNLKPLPNGETNPRYFAADCFHFSQLGHANLANNIWNGMMLPFGEKPLVYTELFERFECPSWERPYLATRQNSHKWAPYV